MKNNHYNITVNNVNYPSLAAAAEKLKTSRDTLTKMVKRNGGKLNKIVNGCSVIISTIK